MPQPAYGPLRMLATALGSMGLFSVFYPAIVLLFAPRPVLATHHLCFLAAGMVLLPSAWLLFRIKTP